MMYCIDFPTVKLWTPVAAKLLIEVMHESGNGYVNENTPLKYRLNMC